MDMQEVDKLIEAADRRAVYANQVEHVKEKFRTMNVLAWDGHIFELDPGFISYVLLQFMRTQSDGTPCILLDKNQEPVLVMDMAEFVDQMEESHTEALNEYLDAYQRLRTAQNTSELVEVA